MKRFVVCMVVLFAFCICANPLFAGGRYQSQKEYKKPEQKRVQISQEEYDSKIRTANTIMIAGGATAGAGAAAVIASIAWAASNKNAGMDNMKIIIPAGIGGLMMITGGVAAAIGGLRKHSIKRKYYTVGPMVDPGKGHYGLMVGVNF